MRYLLDTNIWIIYLKAVETTVRARLEQTTPADLATCSIVWAELLHGARKIETRRSCPPPHTFLEDALIAPLKK